MDRIRILKGDITKIAADAVVNAANTSLLGGGGVDGAIHRAAGRELLEECQRLNGCKTGQAKLTGGYRLPAKYIIHTPGPIWRGGNSGEEALLKSCYLSCLSLARDHQCRTLAFPSISTGVYRFPLEKAAEIALGAIRGFLEENNLPETVSMVCFDDVTKSSYEKALRKLEGAVQESARDS